MFCYLRWQSSLICNGSVTSVANRVLPPPAPRCLRPVDLANRTGVVSCWRGRLGSGCRMQESGMGVFSLCTFFLKHKFLDNESCVIIFISAYGPYIPIHKQEYLIKSICLFLPIYSNWLIFAVLYKLKKMLTY